MKWTDREVRAAFGSAGGTDEVQYAGISTDTRAIIPGALFVALVGDRFDGHRFLEAAKAAGATGAVVREDTPPVDGLRLYPVEDTLRAYGWLARHRRRQLTGPVVAVTGTNGKTSTKEMLAAALRTRFRVHATKYNLNNLVGVPQTILEAPEDADAMVVEAGANLPGEIARYREIIEPSITVITNVAPGHLEGFGTVDGVRVEKLSLARHVPVAIVGAGDPQLATGAREEAGRVVIAGLENADLVPDSIDIDETGHPRLTVDGRRFTLGLLGRHQAANAMLVWAVARELTLDLDQVAAALAAVTVPGGRGELTQIGRLTILNDSYNANPASFRALIDLVASMRGERRLVFVAGTMRELGPDAPALHEEIADRLVALQPDLLAAVGEFTEPLMARRAALGDRLVAAPDAATMGALLRDRLRGDELVVLKGSRGVTLERILPELRVGSDRQA